MGQAEIQKLLSKGDWYSVSDIVRLISTQSRSPACRCLKVMKDANEIKVKIIKEKVKGITRSVPYYKLI